ncbi:MFS transporter [Caballeronia sp. LZ043]|uniref:MFS transporter n=1 Tax=Caballeronia sp. LZ043 TaxID=3038569 RepID=UPI0028613F4B|nr:MFS transporter [Caballeronia sp. LZ043]MDR5822382.1 MFS transporter [Caballeronia sp. LZ043]
MPADIENNVNPLKRATREAGVMRARGFVPLWTAGAVSTSMMWLEMLAAALFTFKATHSSVDVALVSACRSVPLLLSGAVMGVLADALDRRKIVLFGLLLAGASSASVAVLSIFEVLSTWHLCVAALVSGVVYATEMPARRRMIAEAAGAGMASRAVAIDSMTSYATRSVGPVLGGWIYGTLGVSASYLLSAAASFCAAAFIGRLSSVEMPSERLSLARIRKDLVEASQYARGNGMIMTLLLVTIITNLCGYSYNVLLTPLGRETFNLSALMIGVLSSAEPAGSFLAGLIIGNVQMRVRALNCLIAGSVLFFSAIAIAGAASFVKVSLAWLLLIFFIGGFGSAAYNIHQTTIVIESVPSAMRSRVFGLVTVGIGCWPIGTMLAGLIAEVLSPSGALLVLGAAGLVSNGLLAHRAMRSTSR